MFAKRFSAVVRSLWCGVVLYAAGPVWGGDASVAVPGGAGADAPSQAGHAVLAAVPAPSGKALRGQGTLFKVSRAGQAGYLFGTIHVGAKSLYPLAPAVSAALADTDQLVLELDTRANDAFQMALANHASYRQGESIRQFVSADTLTRLTRALHAVGITLSSVAHLKPWLLANLLMGLELERNGYQRMDGNEFFLLAHAQARGTAVTELESPAYQLALFDTLSRGDAERYLRESLAELDDGTSLRKARATIDAWSSGDPVALDALMPDAVGADTVMSAFTRRTLLGKRNPEMAHRIERLMQDGKRPFVGVGLLHLLGEEGVPELLARRGYHVERVY
jgi:uncharacterized protein YbaP (TraB family)